MNMFDLSSTIMLTFFIMSVVIICNRLIPLVSDLFKYKPKPRKEDHNLAMTFRRSLRRINKRYATMQAAKVVPLRVNGWVHFHHFLSSYVDLGNRFTKVELFKKLNDDLLIYKKELFRLYSNSHDSNEIMRSMYNVVSEIESMMDYFEEKLPDHHKFGNGTVSINEILSLIAVNDLIKIEDKRILNPYYRYDTENKFLLDFTYPLKGYVYNDPDWLY